MPDLKSFTFHYPRPPDKRVAVLDELRGLAILLVITYHTCGVTGFINYEHGELGVDMFVLLSGAALALRDRPEEGALKFLWRRMLRILPAYWIALTLFWQGGVHLLGRIHTATDIWSHYLCIHPFWGDKYILGFADSFWFLGLIVPLYIFYAFLRRFFDRMDIMVGVGLVVSFALTYYTAKIAGQPALFVHVGLRPPIFFVGLVFGRLLRDGVVNLPLTAWLGLGVFLTWYGTFVTGLFIGYNIAGFAVFLTYFILRANSDAAGRRLLCRAIAWLGIYSYEIFLLHQPLIRDYNHYIWNKYFARVPNPLELGIGVAVALPVVIAASFLLHHLVRYLSKHLLESRA